MILFMLLKFFGELRLEIEWQGELWSIFCLLDFIQLNQPFQQIIRVKEGEIVRVQKGQEIGRKGILSQNDAFNLVFRDCASSMFGGPILNNNWVLDISVETKFSLTLGCKGPPHFHTYI